MAIEKVREYFSQYGIEGRIREFEVSSATVELASKALGCSEGKIAKSLSYMVDGSPIIIVVAGDIKVSNSKYKSEFGTKAKMLTFEEAESLIGHRVGGVCPFAINEGVRVFLDISLKEYDTVFPACGSSNSAIELTIAELEKYSNFQRWVDVGQEKIID